MGIRRSDGQSLKRGALAGVAFGIVAVVIAVIVGVVALAGYAWSSTDSSNAACVYNGGPLDNKNFKKSVAPGTGRQGQGMFSKVIEYPVGIVQYDESDGLQPVAVSVGGFTQTYQPTLNFTLSSVSIDGKPMACLLIEQRLKRIGATDFYDDFDSSGWVQKFLNVSVQPAVREAIPRVINNGDPTDLYLNQDDARDKAAVEVARIIGNTLEAQLGNRYFCSTTYRYGQPVEACGEINVVLPQPTMNEADLAIIRAPQEAKTKADNEIAVAREAARQAAGVAEQRTAEAQSATQRADADVLIAEQQGRTDAATVANDYLWCQQLVALGQRCDLVRAAEQGDYPDVVTGGDVAIAVPTETTVPG